MSMLQGFEVEEKDSQSQCYVVLDKYTYVMHIAHCFIQFLILNLPLFVLFLLQFHCGENQGKE